MLPGCAKYPSGGSASTTADLLITMTVAGQINPNDYYFVAFNTSNVANPTAGLTGGPCPVVTSGGNGFVSGAATQYVEYHGTNSFAIYSFTPGTNLYTAQYVGSPSQFQVMSNTLQFRIPLSYLATSSIPVTSINHIQINFMNYDNINDSVQFIPVHFDSLGNSIPGSGELNDYITISTGQGATYNNVSEDIEPQGDVEVTTNNSGGYIQDSTSETSSADQSLDIVGWSVQVEN